MFYIYYLCTNINIRVKTVNYEKVFIFISCHTNNGDSIHIVFVRQ